MGDGKQATGQEDRPDRRYGLLEAAVEKAADHNLLGLRRQNYQTDERQRELPRALHVVEADLLLLVDVQTGHKVAIITDCYQLEYIIGRYCDKAIGPIEP